MSKAGVNKASAAKAKVYSGGCLCGAVRFEAIGLAGKPHTCSCRMCQRHTGALTAAWVEFPSERVTWTGPGGAPAVYRSSDYSSRAFCPACGSSFGAVDDAPVVALLLGVFDKPGATELMPTGHSFKGGRPKMVACRGKSRLGRARVQLDARERGSLCPNVHM